VVDNFWPEIADSITVIERLSEEEDFPKATLAAALASKCFYHLEEYSLALRLALGSGEYFDVSSKSEYVDTLISSCIDEYIKYRIACENGDDATIDDRMVAIVEEMFERCFQEGALIICSLLNPPSLPAVCPVQAHSIKLWELHWSLDDLIWLRSLFYGQQTSLKLSLSALM
jgi:hypothetical protein